MRRSLPAVGLVVAVLAALASVPAFLGPALGHSVTSPDLPGASIQPTPASPSPAASLAPVDFESSDGYRLTLPGGWTAANMDTIQEQLLLNVLRSSDLEIANLIDSVLRATGGDISMVGGDIRGLSANGVPPNVSVITQPSGTEALSSAAQRIGGTLAVVDGVAGSVRHSDTTLDGLEARRLDWSIREHTAGTQAAAPDVALTTYIVQVEDRTVLLTVATNASTRTVNQPILDAIVASFHRESTPGP